ncbi:hypothetical protein ACMFMG_003377 [Clarireedia jacksonii]
MMEVTLANFVAAALGICVGIYFILPRNAKSHSGVCEPPSGPTAIPYLGHMIGMARKKFNYYVDLSHKSHLPILTLALPGVKMYIINNVSLIQFVQKQPRTLAFPPIAAKFASRVCGVSPEATKICMTNVNGEDGNFGLSMDSHVAIRDALLPGAGLDQMNRLMIENVANSVDSLIPSGHKIVQIGLSAWLREMITLATTNSVYGPQNPFKRADIRDDFWKYESQLMRLLFGIFPSILARTGFQARARVAQAFEQYFRAGGVEQASILMRNRYEAGARNGVPEADIARYEVGGSIAILVNTAPALFWLMYFVYADSKLLEDIRKEVGALVEVRRGPHGETIRSLDITNVKTSCPLLLSAFQETLRHRSMGTSVREVMTDTILDGKWLLKKNSMVQMPSRVIHLDSDVWGNDVHEFKAGRFLTGTDKENSKSRKRANPAAFRAFGGGSTLCPGRHFATNEILAVVSMFVMRFDMRPVSGQWKLPKADNTNVAAVIMEPDTDIEVVASVRKGYEDGDWAFSLRDSEVIVPVVDEDCVT